MRKQRCFLALVATVAAVALAHAPAAAENSKKRKQKAGLTSGPACPAGHGPFLECPYGYKKYSSTECHKVVDSALQWGCTAGTFDSESHSCITQHRRPAKLQCPSGYSLRGTVCEALSAVDPRDASCVGSCCGQLQQCLGGAVIPRNVLPATPVPRLPSLLATPECRQGEKPDAFDGTCTYEEHWAPRPVCAGDIVIRPANQALLCRVTVKAPLMLVCKFGPLQPPVEQLDILSDREVLKQYFKDLPVIINEPWQGA